MTAHTASSLTHDAYIIYLRRVTIGDQCLEAAGDDSDRETAAADAISAILTTLYGPAGYYTPSEVTTDEDAMSQARDLLDRALRSYQHDNEDYIVEAS